jgi:hypothetical protein
VGLAEEMQRIRDQALRGEDEKVCAKADREWAGILISIKAAAEEGKSQITFKVGGSVEKRIQTLAKRLKRLAKDEGFSVRILSCRVVQLEIGW